MLGLSSSHAVLLGFLIACVGMSSMGFLDAIVANTPWVKKLELSNASAGWIKTGISLKVDDPFEVDARGIWHAGDPILAPSHILRYRVSEHVMARNFRVIIYLR